MADIRFFPCPHDLTLTHICAVADCELASVGDGDFIVGGVAALDVAEACHLSFLDNSKYRHQFKETKAGACIIHPDMVDFAPRGMRLLLSKTPYKSYALAAQALYPEAWPEPRISKTAVIDPSAKIGKDVHISEFVVVGAGVEIGDNVWIESHVSIGQGVVLGDDVRVGCHVRISHAKIGHHSRIYPGSQIGQDGFGFAIDPTGFVKVPQLGRVIIGSRVEIGANTTIDRGSSGDTIIGDGCWIDNLVQIGHNVKIGKGCVLAAQVGIAGSTELDDFVIIGGQAGVAGHLHVGLMAKIAAKSGVTKNIPAKEEWMGYPAIPMKRYLRQAILLKNMTEKK